MPGGPEEPESLIRVYPNPATDEVWVEFLEMFADGVQLELFDTGGRLVYRQEFPPYQTLIRLNPGHIPEGVYFLHVTAGNAKTTAKIVILR